MDELVQLFSSKEYRFLQWLKSREQTTTRGLVINFSQEEIAAEYGSSPATVNKWLQALKAIACVEQKKKASYHITEIGNAVITQMKEIERIVGGTVNAH